ncbi:cytochrome P450 [Nonomuraea bangladeshensis]|uniref:Cytochrome P450 n=1 Tax=Nonomuraea bangladeshensis TaxID=404385 RepID=A0ABV3HD68_9ACTN
MAGRPALSRPRPCSRCSTVRGSREQGLTRRRDVTRGAAGHAAFGHGVHHCLGAPPARMEMRVALPALLRRFPGLALAEPYERVDFRVFSLVYGVHSLRVTW